MQLKGKIAAFAAAIMLGGCAFGLAGSPPATYDLQAPLVERVHGGGSVQLTIYPPVAVKTIDTEEILVKGANGRVAYFSGAIACRDFFRLGLSKPSPIREHFARF